MPVGKSRWQLLVAPVRMKQAGRNDAQLCIYLVIEARSSAVKSNIAKELGMSGP